MEDKPLPRQVLTGQVPAPQRLRGKRAIAASRLKECRKGTDGTLYRTAPDEPVFVLRAQDVIAPLVVEQWASVARNLGVPQHKVKRALRCAEEMRKWPGRRLPD